MADINMWEQMSRIWVGTAIDGPKDQPLMPIQYIYKDSILLRVYQSILKLVHNGHEPTIANIMVDTDLPEQTLRKLQETRTSDLSMLRTMLPEAAMADELRVKWDGKWRQIALGDGTIEQKMALLYEEMNNVKSGQNGGLVPMGKAIDRFISYTRDIASGKIKIITLPEQWGLLHEKVVLKPTDAMLVNGFTGDGKTTAMLQLALWWADQGFCVIFISAETTETSLGGKLLTGFSALEQQVMLRRGVSEFVERTAQAQVRKVTENGSLYFWAAEANLPSIIAGCRAGLYQAMAEERPIAIIVDYVQKVHDAPGDSERERFAHTVNAFKSFLVASEKIYPPGAVGVMGSQINDEGEAYGSRQIEQFVQVIISIEKRGKWTGEAKLFEWPNGTTRFVCPECGSKIKTYYKDNIVLCKSCNSVVQKLHWVLPGGRSYLTKLHCTKNNDGAPVSQAVTACWWSIQSAFNWYVEKS